MARDDRPDPHRCEQDVPAAAATDACAEAADARMEAILRRATAAEARAVAAEAPLGLGKGHPCSEPLSQTCRRVPKDMRILFPLQITRAIQLLAVRLLSSSRRRRRQGQRRTHGRRHPAAGCEAGCAHPHARTHACMHARFFQNGCPMHGFICNGLFAWRKWPGY